MFMTKCLAVLCCLQHLVGCLAKVLDSRDSTSPEVAAAGMVINTMGYIDGLGYELLAAAVATFRVSLGPSPELHPCIWIISVILLVPWGKQMDVVLTGIAHACDCWLSIGCILHDIMFCVCKAHAVWPVDAAVCCRQQHWQGQSVLCCASVLASPLLSVRHPHCPFCAWWMQADVVLVMDQDRLYTQLTDRLKVGGVEHMSKT
jgi:hypothetical protein